MIKDKYTSSYTTSVFNRSLNTFSKNNAICVEEAYQYLTMANVEDQDIDIRRREDAIAEVIALKGREYGKGVTRCCHEEFIKP